MLDSGLVSCAWVLFIQSELHLIVRCQWYQASPLQRPFDHVQMLSRFGHLGSMLVRVVSVVIV
ncbi:hypothetical protein WK80_16405 [Burkholderia multivorans]|nr:hypothetical protein WK80_16405 [Burkholderia multivorans]